MRFDTLGEIRRREARRSRSIRQRHREEHARKFAFKQHYDRAYRKSLSDYQAVRVTMEQFRAAGRKPTTKLTCSEEQKVLLLLLLVAEKFHRDQKQSGTVNQAFIVHLYALTMVELQKSSYQTLRLMTGVPTLAALRNIGDWSALFQLVEKSGGSGARPQWETVKEELGGKSRGAKDSVQSQVVESASVLHAQVSELKELIAADPKLAFENSSFIFHLHLRVGLDTMGLGFAMAQMLTVTTVAALPVVLLGIACLVSAATFYANMKDIEEYNQSWDSEVTSLRDTLGQTLGMIAEVADLANGLGAVYKTGGKIAATTFAKKSTWLNSSLNALDLERLMRPEAVKTFERVDRFLAALRASRALFSDVVPKLSEIARQHPDAAPEVLVRGVLTMGLELSKLHSKIQASQFVQVGSLVADVWSAWDQGQTVFKKE